MVTFRLLYGKRYRGCDKPAVVDGDKQEWYNNGDVHRHGDKPAIIDTYYQ